MAAELTKPDIGNRFLLALPPASLDRIRPQLDQVDLTPRHVLSHVGAPTEHVYFVNRGLVSLVKTMQDGRTVEVGAVGFEGIVGVFALYGLERAMWESVVQGPGTAFRIKLAAMQDEVSRSEPVRQLLRRYAQLAVGEIVQTAACNRLHTLEERCCRWLLIAHDSARSDTFPLTHEFLALMLGVQRSGLSITASILQKAGLIRYTRGRVTITDRTGLETAACECYGTIRAQLDALFGPAVRA